MKNPCLISSHNGVQKLISFLCVAREKPHIWWDFGSALPFQTRLTQTKPVLPLSNEHGSQVKDQGRRQCCHNKHKNFPIGLHVMYLYFPDTPPMYACTYVCMYVCMCMFVCMYVCVYVCIHACLYVCMYACMYVYLRVCMCVCMFYACMYVCMYVCVCNEDLKKSVINTKTKVRCVFWIRETMNPAPLP